MFHVQVVVIVLVCKAQPKSTEMEVVEVCWEGLKHGKNHLMYRLIVPHRLTRYKRKHKLLKHAVLSRYHSKLKVIGRLGRNQLPISLRQSFFHKQTPVPRFHSTSADRSPAAKSCADP